MTYVSVGPNRLESSRRYFQAVAAPQKRILRGQSIMATDRANDLRAFRDFADAKLSHGEAPLSLDDALDLWEYENASEAEREATLQAIRSGLDDMDAERTVDAIGSAEKLRAILAPQTHGQGFTTTGSSHAQ